jgi:hypothetical protein
MKTYCWFIFIILSFSGTSFANFEDNAVSPNEKVNSLPLSSYANMWWQWTNTMPPELSPIRDQTGVNCHIGQQGDVWFLAGGYGSSEISRTCVIPEGKHIFFPVINMVYYPRYQKSSYTCNKAKDSATLNNDALLYIEVELDYKLATNPREFRISSEECFDLLGMIPKEYNAPKVYPSATDGYWIMLKPLTKGEHELTFKAQYNRIDGSFGEMAQDIKYKLIVK